MGIEYRLQFDIASIRLLLQHRQDPDHVNVSKPSSGLKVLTLED